MKSQAFNEHCAELQPKLKEIRPLFRTRCWSLRPGSGSKQSPWPPQTSRSTSLVTRISLLELSELCSSLQAAFSNLSLRLKPEGRPGFALPLLFTELAAHPGILSAPVRSWADSPKPPLRQHSTTAPCGLLDAFPHPQLRSDEIRPVFAASLTSAIFC